MSALSGVHATPPRRPCQESPAHVFRAAMSSSGTLCLVQASLPLRTSNARSVGALPPITARSPTIVGGEVSRTPTLTWPESPKSAHGLPVDASRAIRRPSNVPCSSRRSEPFRQRPTPRLFQRL